MCTSRTTTGPADPERYVGLPLRAQPHDYPPHADLVCPVCAGHGKWNTRLHAYGPGQHSRIECPQCHGWGWVSTADAACCHTWRAATSAECRHHPRRFRSEHLLICQHCGATQSVDSSD